MADAWELARKNICRAQTQQKRQHDHCSRPADFKVGDRVFVYMPAAKLTKADKFARPFYGPYRVVETCTNGVEVCPVDGPQTTPIRVALNRVRFCPAQLADAFWPSKSKPTKQSVKTAMPRAEDGSRVSKSTTKKTAVPVEDTSPGKGIWTERLRWPRTSALKRGEM